MTVVPYEHAIELPTLDSPFLRGVTGPGFFSEPKKALGTGGEEDEDEMEEEKVRRLGKAGMEKARRETRRSEAGLPPGFDGTPIRTSLAVGRPVPVPGGQKQPSYGSQQQAGGGNMSSHDAAAVVLGQTFRTATRHSGPVGSVQGVTGGAMSGRPTGGILPGSRPGQSRANLSMQATNRNIASTVGGTMALDILAMKETLPADTGELRVVSRYRHKRRR
jgi:hypothetical protein